MAYYYKITFERKNENDEIEKKFCYFLYPHHTHWIYDATEVLDGYNIVTVEYCRTECRHTREYLVAWRNSCQFDEPVPNEVSVNDENSDSDEEPSPNNNSTD